MGPPGSLWVFHRRCCPSVVTCLSLQLLPPRLRTSFIYLQDHLFLVRIWKVLREFMFFSSQRGMTGTASGSIITIYFSYIKEERGHKLPSAGERLLTLRDFQSWLWFRIYKGYVGYKGSILSGRFSFCGNVLSLWGISSLFCRFLLLCNSKWWCGDCRLFGY